MTDRSTLPRSPLLRVALAVALLALATAFAEVVVIDDLDREVRLEAHARRVVSMIPSHTETVCALDACDLLVGRDTFSNHPAEVTELPDLGSAFAADLEALLQLEPDLVLTDPFSGLHEALVPFGIPVYVAVPERVEEVYATIREIGALVGRDGQADALVTGMRDRIAALSAEAAAREPVRVFYEVDATPYSVGPESYLGELLALAGGDNVVPAGLGDFPQVDPETVLAADPEVILLSDAPYGESAATVAERPGWAALSAVEDGRVVELDQDQVDLLNRAGPRLPDALELLVGLLHPER